MSSFVTFLKKFFGVAVRGQTYLNMLYLFLAFPLGLFYFVFLVSGLSIGIGTIIVWIGILFLLAVFAVWYGLMVFERQMAIWLLRVNIPPIERPVEAVPNQSVWQRFKNTASNPVTWKGLVYLLAKFPLGILSFVLVVTFLAVSASLVTAPIYYSFFPPSVAWDITRGFQPVWVIDTLPEALLLSLIGLVLTFIFMHILNGLAWISGQFARWMLGYYPPSAAVTTGPVAGSAVPVVAAPAAAAADAAPSAGEPAPVSPAAVPAVAQPEPVDELPMDSTPAEAPSMPENSEQPPASAE